MVGAKYFRLWTSCERPFSVLAGSGTDVYGGRDAARRNLEIKVNHPGVIREIIRSASLLVTVDLLTDGHLDFSGDIDDLIAVFCHLYGIALNPSESLLDWCRQLPALDQPFEASPDWRNLALNSPQRDQAVV
jgi:hypothetical protein